MTLSAEGIDKIRDKVFFAGTGFEDFFLVFDNDFVIGDFDYFFAGDDEFGVEKAFDERAPHDDLLQKEIVGVDGKIGD